MDIRPATPKDIPGILALLRQVGGVHHAIRPDIFRDGACKYDASTLEALLQDPDRPIFIADDGSVAGYCFCILRQYRDDTVLTDRLELYIDDLCVDETRHRQGIASRLYRRACEYAREKNCAFVTLNVWTGNDGAQHFYENMGMTPRSVTMEYKL